MRWDCIHNFAIDYSLLFLLQQWFQNRHRAQLVEVRTFVLLPLRLLQMGINNILLHNHPWHLKKSIILITFSPNFFCYRTYTSFMELISFGRKPYAAVRSALPEIISQQNGTVAIVDTVCRKTDPEGLRRVVIFKMVGNAVSQSLQTDWHLKVKHMEKKIYTSDVLVKTHHQKWQNSKQFTSLQQSCAREIL